MPPDADLQEATRLGGITDVIADPANLAAASALPVQTLVLGGGESRQLDLPADSDVIDMEQIDPDAVELPGWYRPNPSYARDVAFVVFSAVGGGALVPKQITNYRWSLSAFGTASAAALNRNDTVYCLTPLHHQSGLLVSLGGSVVAGSRIALSRGLCPERFPRRGAPVRRLGGHLYLVDAARGHRRPQLHDVGQQPDQTLHGSGMPTGLWE